MNPFFRSETEVQIKPKIAVLLDGSESTTISKNTYRGMEDYRTVIARIRDNPENTELEFLSFGNSVQVEDPGTFSPASSSTNLYDAIEYIVTSDGEYESAILISDGIISLGKNPVVEASNSPIPIHVISIGDTSKVKDIAIKNIYANGTGFTNTKHNVTVELSHFGFSDKNVRVLIKSGTSILEAKSISLQKHKEIESIEFEIELSEEGLKQYEIEVESIAGEWVTKNNSSSFSIDVLDSKTKILHIAAGVHPDVKAIRSLLARDQNIELSTYTYLGSLPALKNIREHSSFDLVILHGAILSSVLTELGITISDTPTLFITLPDRQSMLSAEPYSVIDNDTPDLFDVTLQLNEEQANHPILEVDEINLSTLAPIQSSIQALNTYPNALTLYYSNFQNIPTASPVVSILEQGSLRKSQLNASGWYKMYLSPNTPERNFIIQLLSNLADWTSSDPDNRLLKIRPISNSFSSGEQPVINAGLINENGVVESEAVIELTISGESFSSDFTMNNLGSGNYSLQVPELPKGRYSFSATARKGNRDIDSQSGEFIVTESNVELSNTVRNDDLLSSIAANSGGTFFNFTSVGEFWSSQKVIKNLESYTETKESFFFPVRSIFWFVIVLLLLGSEWLVRKRFALP